MPSDPLPLVTLDEIKDAARRIAGVAVRTPVLEVAVREHPALSRVHGPRASSPPVPRGRSAGPAAGAQARIALKCENLQPMGAFKIRGACNMIAQLSPAARAAGVITYSSGNHGQAVALVAQQFGIPAVVVMPNTAPPVKVEGVGRYGAEVILVGPTSLERKARAEAEAASRGLTIVPPFDHPWIIAGAGTVGMELLEQHPEVTAVYVPVGGGGLLSGVAAAIKQTRHDVRVIGVEPVGAPKMGASLSAGHPVTLGGTASIADGLLPVRPGDLTFAHVRAFVDQVITVEDAAIAEAVRWLFREARVVAEPSGAITVAAALSAAEAGEHARLAVISGGNVGAEEFAKYLLGSLDDGNTAAASSV